MFVPSPRALADPECPPNSPAAFCARLKATREARGVTLAAIAEATKISSFLLASLEDNKVSRWPGGIYRRAFFTAYVEALDLPIEPTVREFLQLFPDEETSWVDRDTGVAAAADGGRLSLGDRRRGGPAQACAALTELTFVVVVAVASAAVTDWSPWSPAIVAGAWYGRPIAAAIGRRLGARVRARRVE